MTNILPVASGKGGVGKTVCTANLGVALARAGKTVILVDLDLGGANLHTCLGVRNNRSGIGHFVNRQEDTLESLLVETSERRLFFIPGDALLPGTANLPYFRKEKIIKRLPELVADFVLLDLGAGTAYNTLDFFLLSAGGLLVVAPETTSILNAYSFIKSAIFRLLSRSFPNRSRERDVIAAFAATRLEGSGAKLGALVGRLAEIAPESGELARSTLDRFAPRVIINMGRDSRDIQIGAKLREIVRRNLEIDVQYIGFLPYDSRVGRSIIDRVPTFSADPGAPFAQSLAAVAQKLLHSPAAPASALFGDDEDLEEVNRVFLNTARQPDPHG